MNCIALLGGSFDPIHNGHLHLAREIIRLEKARTVAFLPNARHNFKGSSTVLDFSERFSLVRDALEDGMDIWDDDAEGSGYTADLLRRLAELHPDKRLLWVIGSDNLPALPRWFDYPWLRDHASFLIIPRPGYPLEAGTIRLRDYQVLDTIPSPISSSLVRERIANGEPISGLVPAALEARIVCLYQPLMLHS